jgi:protoporphyrinogen oxidase
MMRMAVSSLGRMDTTPNARFRICMENGMVLDAKAIIVTAPARYAERIFHTLKPEISYRLLDYRYDSIARVSLGYPAAQIGSIPHEPPPDYPISYLHQVTHPERVPPGHVLIQAGIRYEPDKGIPPDVVGELAALMGWSPSPVVERVTHWKEADPLMWLDDGHAATMRLIGHLLPDGIALAGSDYIATGQRPTLQDRITAGRAAAIKAVESGK